MRVVENGASESGDIEIMRGSEVLQQERSTKRKKKAQVKERDQRSNGNVLAFT